MKAKKQLLLMVIALISLVLPASAIGLEDIRLNARFLTDRMAFELNLNTNQYNDLYEVNYDFFNSVDPYLADMARQDAYALDRYYRYLDERNDDLRWILSNAEYTRFLALDYFFRPFYALNNLCYLRIYQRYPDRSHFYFHRPAHYLTYCGGHGRAHWHGASYYERHYPKRYRHPVYRGDFRSRPEYRGRDFGPRPAGGPGFHFTPVDNHRPGMGNGRPNGGNFRPDMNRPNNNRQDRPNNVRPNMGNNRPFGGNSRPDMSRPNNNRYDRPNNVRPDMGNNRPFGGNSRPDMNRPSNNRQDRPNNVRPDMGNNRRQDRPSMGNSRSSNNNQRGGSSVRRGNPDGQRGGSRQQIFQRDL